MGSAISVRGLRKRFGEHVALDGIDLEVEEGSVYGFLGPNGAGKTTTLRILTGLARADAGEVSLFGHAAGSAVARRTVGFLPDVPGFYPWMTAPEFLRFSGRLFGIDRHTLDERVSVLLDLAGLVGVTSRVGGFSRGMRQRLGIAQALVNAPKLLLLDEPTSALDPLGRKEVLDMIASLAGRTTVFFSTHILADVERVCETVAILDSGRVVVESGIDELTRRYATHRLEIDVAGDGRALLRELETQAWTEGVTLDEETGRISATVTDLDAARAAAPGLIAASGVSLHRFDSGDVSLEDVFVQLVRGSAR